MPRTAFLLAALPVVAAALTAVATMTPAAETPLSEGLQIAITRVVKTTVTEQVDVPQPAEAVAQGVEHVQADEARDEDLLE